MASITYWSQLAPTTRAQSIAEGLAARVRDPAWLLARQWQLCEFQGADAGSPAFARIVSRTAALSSARLGAAAVPLGPNELLEPVVEPDCVTADLATRVELGQTFETLVPTTALRDAFRGAYPIAPASADADGDTARFLAVCAGRATDGVALYQAAKKAYAAHLQLPPQPALDAAAQAQAVPAVAAFVVWVESTWGPISGDDPRAWDAARLEYHAGVSAGSLALDARPDGQSTLDWYSFDLVGGSPPPTAGTTTSVIPGHVRFRGMPSARWWDFESSQTDFGAIVADLRDLSKLLFADFLLLHGDDWYLAPLDVPTGKIGRASCRERV